MLLASSDESYKPESFNESTKFIDNYKCYKT